VGKGNLGSHTVMRFTQKVERLLTLGKKGQAEATRDSFNKPTGIVFARLWIYLASGARCIMREVQKKCISDHKGVSPDGSFGRRTKGDRGRGEKS
jgi:hypothetical protein